MGNNAQPINDGRCCDSCNQRVIIARIRKAEAESRGNTYVVRPANDPPPKGEIVKVTKIPTAAELEAAEKAQQELLAMWDSDSSSDSKKSKKSKKEQEKERVRQANKERDEEKRKREAFYKKCGLIIKK